MKYKFINKEIDYTGEQLCSHFIQNTTGFFGDAIIAFKGACKVDNYMVDLSDRMKRKFIYSESMLHFLIEHFDDDLEKTIIRKRLLISIMLEEIRKMTNMKDVERRENGIYIEGKKLTVAVATKSLVSTLIHAGLNIFSANTPIKTSCLSDLGIDYKKFAVIIMKKYCEEMDSVKFSLAKVRGVK